MSASRPIYTRTSIQFIFCNGILYVLPIKKHFALLLLQALVIIAQRALPLQQEQGPTRLSTIYVYVT